MIDALYIHLPFCEVKCNYCDFISFSGFSSDFKERYIKALTKEASIKNNDLEIDLNTIFIGGGTPTCLSGGLLVHLIIFIKECFKVSDNIEISIEANPGTIDNEKLLLLRKAGINRLSLGVQSFDDKLLKILGRIHDSKKAEESFYRVRKAGFTNINIDLMYGLPGQTLKQWEKTLIKTLELNPEHISLYQLKIEEGTPLGDSLKKGEITVFDDEKALKMYKMAINYLQNKGYEHYEIANFSKPGYRCRHNLKYWLNNPYLGLGFGAHSYLPPFRLVNTGNLEIYINNLLKGKLPLQEKEFITTSLSMSETMFMGLRLREGVNLKDFKERYGVEARDVFKKAINKCIKLGLLEFKGDFLRLTQKGLYLGNLVFEEFLFIT